MNQIFEQQPTLVNDSFYKYFDTYRDFLKLYTSNKIMYDILIKNNKFEKYYFTPKSYEELKIAVDMWCNNKKEALIKYGHISSWNITYIINMEWLLYNKLKFNDYISDWNVSNVENMSSMFYGAKNFNQPLNNWNVDNVIIMSFMFYGANSFN